MDTTDVHLLRPVEVVSLLGVSRSWLYDAAKSGRIPCVRLGRYVRFDRGDVLAWLERCKHPGRATTLRRPPSGGV